MAVLLLFLMATLWWRLRGPAWSVVVGLGLATGFLVGGLYWTGLDRQSIQLSRVAPGPFTGTVLEDAIVREDDTRVTVALDAPAKNARVSVDWPSATPPPLAGDRVALRGMPVNSVGARLAEMHRRTGIVGSIKAWSARVTGPSGGVHAVVRPLRGGIRQTISDIPGDGGALLQGVLIGDRSRIRGTALESDFRTTGLSHLLAVSGTHLAIVSLVVAGALRRTGLSRGARIIAALGLAAAYIVLAGVPTSAVRAFIMACAAAFAGANGRRADTLGALACAIVTVWALMPAEVFDIGFALSVASVAGLIVFGALASEWSEAAVPHRARPLGRALATPVVAQLATTPVAIPVFNVVSLVAPAANAIVLPVASLGLGIGIAGACAFLVAPSLGGLMFRIAAAPLSLVCRVAECMSALPFAAIAVDADAPALSAGAAAVMLLLWGWWPRPRRTGVVRLLAVGALVLLAIWVWDPRPGARREIVFLDVGQGDAVLVRDGAHAVLVDTGPDPASMRRALARARVRTLDAVLLTHAHDDHTGGLLGLEGVVRVGAVLVPGETSADYENARLECVRVSGTGPRSIEPGTELRCGGWAIEVLWPARGSSATHDTNDTSLILIVRADDFAAALIGDAEASPQAALRKAGHLADVDVLKVPHHGSAGALDSEALAVWSPELSVISVGTPNRYGHPASTTVRELEESGSRVLRTDQRGDIVVSVRSGAFRVSFPGRGTAAGPRGHGIRRPAYERMAVAAHAVTTVHPTTGSRRDVLRTAGPQECLSDIRQRIAAVGAGDEPAEATVREGRGPGLQPAGIRR